jgi:hypothetical protein
MGKCLKRSQKIMLATRLESCFDGGVIPVLERMRSVQKKL